MARDRPVCCRYMSNDKLIGCTVNSTQAHSAYTGLWKTELMGTCTAAPGCKYGGVGVRPAHAQSIHGCRSLNRWNDGRIRDSLQFAACPSFARGVSPTTCGSGPSTMT